MALALKKFKRRIVLSANEHKEHLPRFIFASTFLLGVLVFIYLNGFLATHSEVSSDVENSWNPLNPEHKNHQTRSPFGAFWIAVESVTLRILIHIGRAAIYVQSLVGDLLLFVLKGNDAILRGLDWSFNCQQKEWFNLNLRNIEKRISGVHLPSGSGVHLPSVPSVHLPNVPSVNLPSVPSVHLPSVPSVNLPSVPNVNLPSVPSVHLPSVPSVHLPRVSDIHLPDVHLPRIPDVHLPSVPDVHLSSFSGCSRVYAFLDILLLVLLLLTIYLYMSRKTKETQLKLNQFGDWEYAPSQRKYGSFRKGFGF